MTTLLAMLAMALLADAQGPAQAFLVNRDGAPQRGCRVDFFQSRQANQAVATAYTDDSGRFLVSNPPNGTFDVKASIGQRSQWTTTRVTIQGGTISPNRLVVDW